ncbi:MAG: hypothetical protein ACI80H_001304 [Pseudoalteromonas distincta]|jgi:hypothetical protein
MKKPNLTDAKYRWSLLYHTSILYLLFVVFDYQDTAEWVFWDFNRLLFLLSSYIIFVVIEYRWDVFRYHRPEKYPTFESKYSNKTYAEHQAERHSKSKDA